MALKEAVARQPGQVKVARCMHLLTEYIGAPATQRLVIALPVVEPASRTPVSQCRRQAQRYLDTYPHQLDESMKPVGSPSTDTVDDWTHNTFSSALSLCSVTPDTPKSVGRMFSVKVSNVVY
jgi:hypothetical protein